MRSDSRNEKCLLPQRGAYMTCRPAGKIAGKYTDVPLSKQTGCCEVASQSQSCFSLDFSLL